MSGCQRASSQVYDGSVIDVQVDTSIPTDIPAPCIPVTAIGHFQVFFTLAYQNSDPVQPMSTYESQEFAFTILRFSNLYPIVFQPLARPGRDTRTA